MNIKGKWKEENGVTLIALVITIIVLLILAAVSITALTGQDGILTKAISTKKVQSHAEVKEAIYLKYSEYEMDISTATVTESAKLASLAEVKLAEAELTKSTTFLEFLQMKEYIDTDGIIKCENLLGRRINLGNGTGLNDVYKIELKNGICFVNYYNTAEDIEEVCQISDNKDNTGDGTLSEVELKSILADANKHEDQEDSDDVGIDEFGNIVNMDLWKYRILDETTCNMGTGDDYDKGYLGKINTDGSIEGNIPTYIKIENMIYEVVKLGDYTFPGNLSIFPKIPKTVTEIGYDCFSGCEFTNVILPDGVIKIDSSAFKACEKLQQIIFSKNLKKIGDEVFLNCKSLTQLNIPQGVTEIGNEVFSGSGLSQITVDINNNYYASQNNVLFTKDMKELIFYANKEDSEYTVPETVEKISNRAFFSKKNLKKINMNEGLKYIGNEAFSDCFDLENIVMPENMIEIGYEAFEHCRNLINIVIPNGITGIRYHTFAYCKNLENVTMPEGVQYIEQGAFNYCEKLSKIYIPLSVTKIHSTYTSYEPFTNCSSTLKIYCGAAGKQSEWDQYWNVYNTYPSNQYLTVQYSVTREQYENM